MTIGSISHLLITLCLLVYPVMSNADNLPDYAREQRITEQIEPDIFDGEAVWLNDGDRDFLGIYIYQKNAYGTVLLLHGRDVNAEEQELIGPLRVGLAENGWNTLSLQMPVLAKGKTYYDYLPILDFASTRIDAAISFVESQGERKIIIAAHSCGAHMANNWFNKQSGNSVDGYIAMGLGATDAGQDLKTPFPIANLNIPVLDIYGSDEFPGPLSMVNDRLAMLRENGHPYSEQITVDGANHYFTGYGDMMVEHLSRWLQQIQN